MTQENKENRKCFWDYFNVHRADSGWLRLFIVIAFMIPSSVAIKYSYLLISKGLRGEFEITVRNFSGYELLITSTSPGIFLAIVAVFILSLALPKTLRSLIDKK